MIKVSGAEIQGITVIVEGTGRMGAVQPASDYKLLAVLRPKCGRFDQHRPHLDLESRQYNTLFQLHDGAPTKGASIGALPSLTVPAPMSGEG